VTKTIETGVIAKYVAGTKQTQSPFAYLAARCSEPPALPGVIDPALRKALECAEPSTVTDEKSVLFGSAIVRSITVPTKAAREPRVLVIDDDPAIAPLVSAALNPFHVCVDCVTSGAHAIICLHSRRYDLLVLDLILGDFHGFEILRHMKADRRFREAKVLVLTADSRLEVLARSFGHGADDFVKKPFAVKELGMRAFRLLDNFGGW
jgi:CheY-like chemotaxis protein